MLKSAEEQEKFLDVVGALVLIMISLASERSSPKFPVKRVAEVINYTPPLILAYLEVLP